MSSNNSISMRARYARRLTRNRLSAELNAMARKSRLQGPGDPVPLPIETGKSGLFMDSDNLPAVDIPAAADPSEVKMKVCIVGAGVAGLRTARLLDLLKEKYPGISYEILEASHRVGGRVYTHYFSEKTHDYYDIGAMRFPKIASMQPVFDLFEEYKLPLVNYYLSANDEHPEEGSVNTPQCFNDIVVVGNSTEEDPFKISKKEGGKVPLGFVKQGSTTILDGVFKPFKDQLYQDFNTGFQALRTQDEFTTRGYLRYTPFQDFFTVQWLETFESSSGLFDQAFTESIIDSFDFDTPGPAVKWYCIDGGTTLLTNAMLNQIQQKPELGKPVTKISLQHHGGNKKMKVQIASEETREYDAVICTSTLACAQRIDLSECNLHPQLKDAIRTLHYDTACKVAIKFSKPWWINEPFGIKRGGVGSTDLPLRTCVYPSYNLHDGADKPAVLLCSYTWAQDASRIGSLIKRDSPRGEHELKELMFRDLARLHSKKPSEIEDNYKYIKSLYLEHHAWDWYQDSYTSGAYALFGPGQFANYYPLITRPAAASRLIFAGEAASAHHAWIVGALESATRAVMQLGQEFKFDAKGVGEFPEPPAEVEPGKGGTLPLQVVMGHLTEEEQVRV